MPSSSVASFCKCHNTLQITSHESIHVSENEQSDEVKHSYHMNRCDGSCLPKELRISILEQVYICGNKWFATAPRAFGTQQLNQCVRRPLFDKHYPHTNRGIGSRDHFISQGSCYSVTQEPLYRRECMTHSIL